MVAPTLGAVITIADSKALARRHLAELPLRWRHVRGVGHRAERVAEALRLGDGALIAAAWLHDIGYGRALTDTGFHPLDGARYLRRIGAGHVAASTPMTTTIAHDLCRAARGLRQGQSQVTLRNLDWPMTERE